jgi:hypothetical protein
MVPHGMLSLNERVAIVEKDMSSRDLHSSPPSTSLPSVPCECRSLSSNTSFASFSLTSAGHPVRTQPSSGYADSVANGPSRPLCCRD